jgi:hypothetical protein
MMRTIGPMAAMLMAATPASAAPEPAVRTGQVGVNLEWPSPPRGARIRVGEVMLTMRNDVDRADSSVLHRSLTILIPGTPAFTIDPGEDDSFPPAVMVVDDSPHQPIVLFQTYSGGAHCCITIKAIVPEGGRLQAVQVYEGDGGPVETPPRDVNGDGRIDFVFPDNAFYYAFASYAESLAPARIVNIVDGRAVDVSDRPDFRSVYEGEIADARAACIGGEGGDDGGNPNGACAAYVAIAARLGRFDAAWAEMLRHYRRDAGIDFPGDRMEGKLDYPNALRRFLIEHHYIKG